MIRDPSLGGDRLNDRLTDHTRVAGGRSNGDCFFPKSRQTGRCTGNQLDASLCLACLEGKESLVNGFHVGRRGDVSESRFEAGRDCGEAQHCGNMIALVQSHRSARVSRGQLQAQLAKRRD